MNNTHLDQAREWARDNIDDFYEGERVYAVCEVIQSLPDEWIDAEKVREVLTEQYMKREGSDTKWINAATIESLLTPPLPTLADMTPEEREACQWMQAQTWHEVGIIAWMDELTEIAQLITRANGVLERKFKDITPRPDLPRLEWPGQEPRNPETSPEETLNNPSSNHSADLPRPEDVTAGEAWLVKCDGREWVGTRESRVETVCSWTLARLDGADYTVARDDEITLVSRLVPEVKP